MIEKVESNTMHLFMALIAELEVNQQNHLDLEDKGNTLCFFENRMFCKM